MKQNGMECFILTWFCITIDGHFISEKEKECVFRNPNRSNSNKKKDNDLRNPNDVGNNKENNKDGRYLNHDLVNSILKK